MAQNSSNMKHHLLTFSMLIASSVSVWSQIPEGGFENWSSGNCGEPAGWSTVNGSTSVLGLCTAQRETADPYAGSSALKIQTGQLGFPIFQTVPGLVSNGTINIQSQSVSGGVPFTERPTAFTGWYKATPVNNDTYSMIAVLINEISGDTIGAAIFEGTATVSEWTQFTVAVDYFSQDTPTLLQINLFASDPNNPRNGSTVYFDELDYQSMTVGSNELSENHVKIYPNPAVSEVFVDVGVIGNATISIYNMLGRKMMDEQLTTSRNRLDLNSLAAGAYVWQLTSTDGKLVQSGRLHMTE